MGARTFSIYTNNCTDSTIQQQKNQGLNHRQKLGLDDKGYSNYQLFAVNQNHRETYHLWVRCTWKKKKTKKNQTYLVRWRANLIILGWVWQAATDYLMDIKEKRDISKFMKWNRMYLGGSRAGWKNTTETFHRIMPVLMAKCQNTHW